LNAAKNEALENEFTKSDIEQTSYGDEQQPAWVKNKCKKSSNDKQQEYMVHSLIKEVTNLSGNDRCCDCNGKEADWLVTNLGILVCIECCGIHR
jgi:hypothetical protein